MKIKGIHFKRGLELNVIDIKDNQIGIHSFDDIGMGIRRKETTGFTDSGELHFVLNRKDFSLLSKFEEMDITMENNTIVVKTASCALRFQNMTAPEFDIDLSGRKEITVDLSFLIKANEFADMGVMLYEHSVIGLGTKALAYIFNEPTGVTEPIWIPNSVFKLLEKNGYMILKTPKLCFFVADGEAVYTTLLEGCPAEIKIPEGDTCEIKINRDNLLEHIKMSENFSKLVQLSVGKNVLRLKSVFKDGDDGNRSYKAAVKAETKLKTYCYTFNAAYLEKLMALSYEKEITLHVNDRIVKVSQPQETAICSAYAHAENKKMELEEKGE